MFEAKITVHIVAPELIAAIAALVSPVAAPVQSGAAVTNTPVIPAARVVSSPANATPVQTSAAPALNFPAPTAAPVNAPAPTTASVPLAAVPTYTLEQLSHAGVELYMRDPVKGQQAQALLAQFGVSEVTAIPKERYGEFATALRGLGASI